MRNLRTALLLVACLSLLSCVINPLSRSPADSRQPVKLTGFLLAGSQPVTIQAVNQNTGALDTLGSTVSSASGMSQTDSTGTTYTLYPWSWTYPKSGGVLPSNYWSPQSIVADLQTAQGHAELFATTNDNLPLITFSPGAAQAAMQSSGGSLETGAKFSDGQSVVLFDQNGVGFGQEGPWTNVQGMSITPPTSGFLPVTWSVGSYTVEGGAKTIYALVCTPTTGGPYPVAIFNHGGTGSTDGGNINGSITAAGWTTQPSGPDSLGQCIDWAKRGWVFATSAYRGENVNITSATSAFPSATWTSGGTIEFCMGEATDVLALTDLVVNHANTIQVGAAGQTVSLNVNKSKVFMYGYSHGGCITWRAIEQGAPITAFSVIEGFTDLRLTYLEALANGATQQVAAIASGAYQFGVSTYQPDAAHVMGYNWRSAHYFASRGDLSIQKFKAMPILILHGDNEIDVTLNSANMPVSSPNPTPLAQPALISKDIGATNIFVGPTGVAAPTSEPCAPGAPGAPLPASPVASSCPINFVLMDTNDPCVANGLPFPMLCAPIALPLSGQPQQQHYLVVYHNMNHINGGFAIKATFGSFIEKNFGTQPGCDGLVINCAND
jgi:dienelactone hydrolase